MYRRLCLTALLVLALCSPAPAASAPKSTPVLNTNTLTVNGKVIAKDTPKHLITANGKESPFVELSADSESAAPGLYFFDARQGFIGSIPGNDESPSTEGCADIYLSPDEKYIAVDEGTSAGMRTLFIFTWPELKPMKTGVSYLNTELEPPFIWGNNAIYHEVDTDNFNYARAGEPADKADEAQRPCPSEVCGPRSVFRTDLASGEMTLIARGTQLCDMTLLGQEGYSLVIGKQCANTLQDWEWDEKHPEGKLNPIERILMPIAEIEARAATTNARIAVETARAEAEKKAASEEYARLQAAARPLCGDAPVYYACVTEARQLLALCAQSADKPYAVLRLSDADGKPLLSLPRQPEDTASVSHGSVSSTYRSATFLRFKDNAAAEYLLFSNYKDRRWFAGLRTLKDGVAGADQLCLRVPQDPQSEEVDLNGVLYDLTKKINYTKEPDDTGFDLK